MEAFRLLAEAQVAHVFHRVYVSFGCYFLLLSLQIAVNQQNNHLIYQPKNAVKLLILQYYLRAHIHECIFMYIYLHTSQNTQSMLRLKTHTLNPSAKPLPHKESS